MFRDAAQDDIARYVDPAADLTGIIGPGRAMETSMSA
jgi:hypothetical protein